MPGLLAQLGLAPAGEGGAERTANRMVKVVLIGGLALIGVCGWFALTQLRNLNAARTSADRFVETVLAHDYRTAEAQMCAEVRDGDGPDWDPLDEYLDAQQGDVEFTYAWLTTKRRTGDDPYTRVRYSVTGANGDFRLEVRMVEEDGGWKPCGIGGVDRP